MHCPGQDESQHAGVYVSGGDLPTCVLGFVTAGHNADLVFLWFDGEDNLCRQLCNPPPQVEPSP